MIVMATEDAVVLRKGVMLFAKEPPAGLMRKIRGVFSKAQIRDIEEYVDSPYGMSSLSARTLMIDASQGTS